jgi:hypothetical protein
MQTQKRPGRNPQRKDQGVSVFPAKGKSARPEKGQLVGWNGRRVKYAVMRRPLSTFIWTVPAGASVEVNAVHLTAQADIRFN